MSMTRQRMDALVDEHFHFEATDDIDGVMSTLLDDAEHEVIPSSVGALDDPAQQRTYYEFLFASIKGESAEPLRRYSGESFLRDGKTGSSSDRPTARMPRRRRT